MSYVTATKQLLGDDLRSLISHFTNFEPTSPSFKRIEDFAWNEIIHKYQPTVDHQEIQGKIEGFVEKFLFHGFCQKADNLKKLVEHYLGLDYFKNAKDANLKWGIILLLIKLSRKPTDALEDDEPIFPENVAKLDDADDESFDWVSYLKEGWEKFKLPDDEISFSGDEFSFTERHQTSFEQNTSVPKTTSTKDDSVLSSDEGYDERLDELIHKEKLASLQEKVRKAQWWADPEFTEPELIGASYCRTWELAMQKEGIIVGPIRIYSEDKVVGELIRLYGTASPNSVFIVCENACFEPKPNISLSVLNPFTFEEILRKEVCRYLPSLKNLNDFYENVCVLSLSDKLPKVYVSYSYALNDILNEYRKELVEIEEISKKKSETVTLRRLFIFLKPWLRVLKKLSSIHSRAIYADYENVDNWMCNVRLLSVLFNELKTFHGRLKCLILRLFLSAFSSYLDIAEKFMKSDRFPDPREEFVIFKPEDTNSALEVRPYSGILSYLKLASNEFFDPFVSVCYRAASSSHFLSQLGKVPSVTRNNEPKGFLSEHFLNNLREYFQLSHGEEETQTNHAPPPPPRLPSIPLPPFSQKWTQGSLESLCQQDVRKPLSSICKFNEQISKLELSTYTLHTVVEKCAISAFTKNLEPEGFLHEVFQNDFKLLEHLKSLRTVFLVQRLNNFLVYLFNKIMLAQQRSVNWNEKFQDCLSDEVPNEMLKNFHFTLGPRLSTKSSDSLKQLAFIKILYKPESHLKSIITDTAIKIYNEIFVFLVQFNWSYKSLFKLRFNLLKENKTNFVRLRRLYSMKMWLIHIMNSFCVYFNSTDEESFETLLVKLFSEARDLQVIRDAHYNFLTECKKRFFLNKGNPCKNLVQRIFTLCSELMFFWHLENNQKLKEFQLNAVEQEYLAIAKALPVALQKKSVQLRSSSLNRLFEVLRQNVPTES